MKRLLLVLFTIAFGSTAHAATLTFNAVEVSNPDTVYATVMVDEPVTGTTAQYNLGDSGFNFTIFAGGLLGGKEVTENPVTGITAATVGLIDGTLGWEIDTANVEFKWEYLDDVGINVVGDLTGSMLNERTFISGDPIEVAGVAIEWVAVPTAVPVPAAAFMLAPALLGLLGLRRKKTPA